MDNHFPNTFILIASSSPEHSSLFKFISQRYKTHIASSIDAVINESKQSEPALILMDSQLQGINSRFIVHALRIQETTKDCHILLFSNNFEAQHLLELYNSGVDDIVNSDIGCKELTHKIHCAITRQISTEKKYQDQISAASSAAMSAITYAGELGILIEAMADISRCKTTEELAMKVIQACSMYELNTCIQIRINSEAKDFSNHGAVGELEKTLLHSGQNAKRIVEFEKRLMLNAPKISLLIRNLPVTDAEKVGRYKDHLAMLLNIAEARYNDIEREMALKSSQTLKVDQQMIDAEKDLELVSGLVEEHRQESQQLMSSLITNLETEMVSLYIDNDQEEKLVQIVEHGRDKMVEMLDRYDTLHHCIHKIRSNMYTIVKTFS